MIDYERRLEELRAERNRLYPASAISPEMTVEQRRSAAVLSRLALNGSRALRAYHAKENRGDEEMKKMKGKRLSVLLFGFH